MRKIGFSLVGIGLVLMLVGILFCFVQGLLISIAIGFALEVVGLIAITNDIKGGIGGAVIITVIALILGGVINPPQNQILEQRIKQLQEENSQLTTQLENDDLGELRELATQMSANAGAYWVLRSIAVLISLSTKLMVKRLSGKTALVFGGVVGVVCSAAELLSASMPIINAELTSTMVNSLLGTATPPGLFLTVASVMALGTMLWGFIDTLISLGMIVAGFTK
ncbi:MAG: hypothetical protein U9O78_00115 [Patescibacteria group bacterium]|nr:hypothetical protein [Patescibacteria group bacterium]